MTGALGPGCDPGSAVDQLTAGSSLELPCGLLALAGCDPAPLISDSPLGLRHLADAVSAVSLLVGVTDGYERSITTDTDVTTMRNPEPGHHINPGQPWAWTLINGLPETVTHTDPDERGLFQLRPRPAEAPTDSRAPDSERQAPARGPRHQGAPLAEGFPMWPHRPTNPRPEPPTGGLACQGDADRGTAWHPGLTDVAR
jgi:hypothetical protein